MDIGSQFAVKVYLAGSLYLAIDDIPITGFHSLKTQAMLAYLVLEGQSRLDRDELAELFWQGYTLKSKRANLRMSLSNLRKLLGEHRDLIEANRSSVCFHRERIWCDVLSVEQIASIGVSETPERLRAYNRILLPGFEQIDSPLFVAWLEKKRAEYASLITQLLKPEERVEGPVAVQYAPTQIVTSSQPKGNLPRSLKRIFGRNKDITTLSSMLESPYHPLITLVGPGGVGKTELATAVARAQREQFPDGVWFIQLEKIRPSKSAEVAQRQVIQQIAHTLRFIPRGNGTLREQLRTYLRQRKTLLILDNFEHVSHAAQLIFDLLHESHEMKMLVTSRQPLNHFSETLHVVTGLEVNAGRDAPGTQLFIDRLQRMGLHTLTQNETQYKAIVDICRLLNGLPLGIELATRLCADHAPTDLCTLLQSDLTILKTDIDAVPERQRSLWLMIAWAWQHLLTWEQQRVLLQCTVIRGAFSAEFATRITHSSHETIRLLTQHGFLTPKNERQFTIHPQIRTFCLERSQNNAALNGWLAQARHHHAVTFVEWLLQQAHGIHRQPERVLKLQRRIADIEQAWQWCVSNNLESLVKQSSLPLANCLDLAGMSGIGIDWFENALALQNNRTVRAHLRSALATLYINRADYAAAHKQVAALQRYEDELSPQLQASLQLLTGHLHARAGAKEACVSSYQQIFRLGRSADFAHIATIAASHLGRIHASENEWESAETVWKDGLRLAEENGDRIHMRLFWQALGEAAHNRHDYKTARQRFENGLELTDPHLPSPDLYFMAAQTAHAQSDYEIAHRYLQIALSIYRQHRMTDQTIEALLLLSKTELLLDREKRAHSHAGEALDAAQRAGTDSQISRAMSLLSGQPGRLDAVAAD